MLLCNSFRLFKTSNLKRFFPILVWKKLTEKYKEIVRMQKTWLTNKISVFLAFRRSFAKIQDFVEWVKVLKTAKIQSKNCETALNNQLL